jgi:hypothetical protein
LIDPDQNIDNKGSRFRFFRTVEKIRTHLGPETNKHAQSKPMNNGGKKSRKSKQGTGRSKAPTLWHGNRDEAAAHGTARSMATLYLYTSTIVATICCRLAPIPPPEVQADPHEVDSGRRVGICSVYHQWSWSIYVGMGKGGRGVKERTK